jgi:hypothetical protein
MLFHPKPVPSSAVDIFTGIFKETPDDQKSYTGKKGEIFVTIALTQLDHTNGWLVFYEGSKCEEGLKPENKTVYLDLNAGDAVIWRSNLVYFHPSGGGGMFLTLVFSST